VGAGLYACSPSVTDALLRGHSWSPHKQGAPMRFILLLRVRSAQTAGAIASTAPPAGSSAIFDPVDLHLSAAPCPWQPSIDDTLTVREGPLINRPRAPPDQGPPPHLNAGPSRRASVSPPEQGTRLMPSRRKVTG